MRDQVLRLLHELDEALAKTAGVNERLEMYLIGRASLVLRLDLQLTTKDVDIIHSELSF